MYVLCVGMYRACSTWQYDVVAHLLEKHRAGRRLGYLTGEQFAELDDREGDDGSWKVLKSHEGHGRFAAALAGGRALAIHAHRDVRDVVFSLMHKRNLDFPTLVRQGMIHQVLANDRFWSARPRMIEQRYDRLIAGPEAGVAELARFLGIEPDPGEVAEIAAEYSFQANRRRTAELGRRLTERGVDLGDPSIAQAHDGRTLLHWNHMREGRVGDWLGRATPDQRRVLARICGPWLAEHGYEADDPAGIDPPRSVAEAARWELAMARGRLACGLRRLSLRHPGAARAIKPWLGIAPEAPLAPPVPVNAAGRRLDEAEAHPSRPRLQVVSLASKSNAGQ